MTFEERHKEYVRARHELDGRVLRGEEDAPPCFTCKAASTHVTDGITPAGYRAYQCADHVPLKPAGLWGSDPGWQSRYITLEEARERAAGRT